MFCTTVTDCFGIHEKHFLDTNKWELVASFERTCRDLLVPCETTELRCERVVKVQGYVWLHFQSQLLFVANILCLVHQVNKTAWWQGQNLCACCPLSSWFQVASAEASRWLCEDLKASSTCQNRDSFMQSLSGLSVLSSVELQRPGALQGLGFHTPVPGAVAGLVSLPGIQGCAAETPPNPCRGQPGSRLTPSGHTDLARSWHALPRILKLSFPPLPWITASWPCRCWTWVVSCVSSDFCLCAEMCVGTL